MAAPPGLLAAAVAVRDPQMHFQKLRSFGQQLRALQDSRALLGPHISSPEKLNKLLGCDRMASLSKTLKNAVCCAECGSTVIILLITPIPRHNIARLEQLLPSPPHRRAVFTRMRRWEESYFFIFASAARF